jgi:RNA polymerase sigma-70 factor (ECF subfamily)
MEPRTPGAGQPSGLGAAQQEVDVPDAATAGAASVGDDQTLLDRLRRGDEAAFVALLERYHGSMVRIAMAYVPNRSVAEEVAQEAWQGVLTGLQRFEGRASLKTWIFRILTNCAKTRGEREGRAVPFSALWDPETDPGEPAVEPERFRTSEPWEGHWSSLPRNWDDLPEERLLAQETRACVQQAIAALPPAQREVITLRDVEQLSAEEACDLLQISEGNQRVLLHRARSKVRRVLEEYLSTAEGG